MAAYSFFLGANSPNGFFSYYDDLIDLDAANEVLVIKGGPGTGKSSFMRRVAGRLADEGLACEYIVCSGDPDSLDGAVFPEIGVALVDGTAPHVVEPRYPYAVERYLHVGAFVDGSRLDRDGIVAATDRYGEPYADAYRCLYAAGAIESEICRSALTADAIERTIKRARGAAKRELYAGAGREKRRFLSANSSKGVLTLAGTIPALADRVYQIESDFGLAAHFLAEVRLCALELGCELISCYDPMAPDSRLAHLFLPEQRLCFTTAAVDEPYRRVHLDGYLDREHLRARKQRTRFLRRTKSALVDEAVAALAEAKRRHDELERLYVPAVDFGGLMGAADELCERLISQYL